MTPPRDEGVPSPTPRLSARRRALVEGVTSALIVYVVAGASEEVLIRMLRPTEGELTWISDAVFAAAIGIAVYQVSPRHPARAERARARRARAADTAVAGGEHAAPVAAAGAVPGNGFEWAAVQIHPGRIGGDFYDFVEQAPGVWMVLVADVSGKGVPAAMALGLLRSIFRTLARELASPAQLVGRLSSALFEEWSGDPYVTCIVARVDTSRAPSPAPTRVIRPGSCCVIRPRNCSRQKPLQPG